MHSLSFLVPLDATLTPGWSPSYGLVVPGNGHRFADRYLGFALQEKGKGKKKREKEKERKRKGMSTNHDILNSHQHGPVVEAQIKVTGDGVCQTYIKSHSSSCGFWDYYHMPFKVYTRQSD